MGRLIQVDADKLDTVLEHFIPDEIEHADAEYDLELSNDATDADVMQQLEDRGDTTHIAYPLLYLREQLRMQNEQDA